MFDMDSMVDQTSPKLEIYITKTGGIPGPPSWELGNYPGFDQMPLQFSATFDDIAATDVGVRDTHPGRLYSVFEVPASYLHTAREYRLFVNQCETPIYSEWLLVYPPTATPDICRPPPGGCPLGSDWWPEQCICGAN